MLNIMKVLTQKNIMSMFPAVMLIKLFILMINAVSQLLFTEVKMLLMNLLNQFLQSISIAKKIIMTEKEEYLFQQSNNCWICKKLIDNEDEKVRDHCHITGKFRGVAHWECKINFQLTKKIPVIFHNLKGYDSHLIFSELHKFNLKVDVIPNGLEKYMAFFLGRDLVSINSMQFMNSSLDKLVKNLSDKILNI